MPQKYVIVGFNASPDERDRVHELAQHRGFKITSDYLRFLIEEDAKVNGFDVNFDVDRGGKRERSEADDKLGD